MKARWSRREHAPARSRRVLLVGFAPLMLRGLEGRLRQAAEVRSVPFPSSEFDWAAEWFDADLVLVDVTYLDQSVVRRLITHRLQSSNPVVVYVRDRGGLMDDLGSGESRELGDTSLSSLVALASGAPAGSVAEGR